VNQLIEKEVAALIDTGENLSAEAAVAGSKLGSFHPETVNF
jgi:hypothetical protein